MNTKLMDQRRALSGIIETKCLAASLRCTCPYMHRFSSGEQVEFAAYLPQFGGPQGILVDPIGERTDTIELQKATAAQLGTTISFVNVDLFSRDEFFLDSLHDWGYFGKQNELSDRLQKLLHIFRSDG